MKKNSFFGKAQRFLEPLYFNKREVFKNSLYFFIEGLFGVLLIFFVKDITLSLEAMDQGLFLDYMFYYMLGFLCLLLLKGYTHDYWAASYNRYRFWIEERYIPEYVSFDMNTQEKVGTGKSISIISNGVKEWGGLLDLTMIAVLKFSMALGVTLYFLFQSHILLVLACVFLLFLVSWCGILLNKRVVYHRAERIKLHNIWSRQVVKIIMTKLEILQSGKIDRELSILHDLHEGQIYYNKKMSPYIIFFFILSFLLIFIILYGVFYVLGGMYFRGEVGLGLIVGISGSLLMMQKELTSLLAFIKDFAKNFAPVQNFWDFFDETPRIEGYDSGNTFQYKTGDIELKNISFSYEEHQKVFDDFSIQIQGGKITALVGNSGGGKSTLVKMIGAYIHPDNGEICIDGQKVSDISLKSYYDNVGYLSQEPSVFDGTVRDNLLYASKREDPEMAYIEKIIGLASCDFIYDLPQGIDTEIGERGVRLSGGQKQRLAIAKIFLKDPKIIILDEPTSALDSVSEKKITKAMHNLFEGRTVLVIAHRLQTVRHADDIIVIENGKMIERGKHAQLVKQGGFYNEMLELQTGF